MVLEVVMAPLLVGVKAPSSWKVDMANVPPEVVVKAVLTVSAPAAVSVPLVLLKVKV